MHLFLHSLLLFSAFLFTAAPTGAAAINLDTSSPHAVTFHSGVERPEACAWSPDGRLFIVSGLHEGNSRIEFWQLDSSGAPVLLNHLDGSGFWIDFSPDGESFYTRSTVVTEKTFLRRWNLEATGELALAMEKQLDFPMYNASLSPDGEWIAVARMNEVNILDAMNGETLNNFSRSERQVIYEEQEISCLVSYQRVVISPVSQYVSISSRCTLSVFDRNDFVDTWEMSSESILESFMTYPPFGLSFSPDEKAYFVTHIQSIYQKSLGASEKVRYVYRMDDAGYGLYPTVVTSVDVSPDGRLLLAGAQDYTAAIFIIPQEPLDDYTEPNNWVEEFIRFRGYSGEVVDAKFSPDGKRVLTVSQFGQAVLWDLEAILAESGVDGAEGYR